MDLNFLHSAEKQKISELEKNLQDLKENLHEASVAFGTKLLNEADKSETKLLLRNELIDNWTNNLESRKNKTDSILKIKSILEKKQQLKSLQSETENLISTKTKKIEKLKSEFAFLAYKNYRDDFPEVIERLPELSKLEAEIEVEKSKIYNRKQESETKGFFEKLMPTVKNILSQGKVSSSEGKIKKLLQQNSNELFSEEDFENLCEMMDELPDDLVEIISEIKRNYVGKKFCKYKTCKYKRRKHFCKKYT